MNSQKGNHKELLKRNETSKSKEGAANTSKEPIHKSGTHSGLRFNFNLKKDVALKATDFKENSNVSMVRKQIAASQNKEGCTDSDDRIKSLKVNVPVNDTQKGVEHSTILTQKEENELCSNVPKSLKVLQPSQQISKVVKPQLSSTMKHEAASSYTSKIPFLSVPSDVKVSKGQKTERKEISKSATGRNTEDSISIVRKQILASQNKEGSDNSGNQIKSFREKVPVNNRQTVEGVEHSAILIKKEETESSNQSLKVLHPSPHTSKVMKSLITYKLTPRAVSSDTTKLPTRNVRDDVKISKSQSTTERKEVSKSAAGRSTEVTHKKFGSHSGLKFKLSVNKSSFTSVEQFGFTSKVSRSNSSKSEMRGQSSKEEKLMELED